MILGHLWKYYACVEPSNYDRWLFKYYNKQSTFKFNKFTY